MDPIINPELPWDEFRKNFPFIYKLYGNMASFFFGSINLKSA